MRFNLPNLLTWARILAIPFLLGVFYFPLGLEEQTKNLIATLLFLGAAMTDWFDGW
ncbi:MAG: CDP-alcohol phosphatidyltransferase family protein, partial [Burkholderiaceae bacterium]